MNTISGVHAVREALRAGPQSIRKIVVAEGSLDGRKREILALARASGIPVYREPRDRVGTQGVTAELVAFEWSDFHELLQGAKTPAFFLALDQIEDPRNFGAVIRAAEGAGVDGVVVPERKTAPPSEVAISASAGALHHAKVARVRNLSNALAEMKERGIWSVGLTPSAKAPWHSFDYTEPVILVRRGRPRPEKKSSQNLRHPSLPPPKRLHRIFERIRSRRNHVVRGPPPKNETQFHQLGESITEKRPRILNAEC